MHLKHGLTFKVVVRYLQTQTVGLDITVVLILLSQSFLLVGELDTAEIADGDGGTDDAQDT